MIHNANSKGLPVKSDDQTCGQICEVSCSSIHFETHSSYHSAFQDPSKPLSGSKHPALWYVLSASSYHQTLTFNIWGAFNCFNYLDIYNELILYKICIGRDHFERFMVDYSCILHLWREGERMFHILLASQNLPLTLSSRSNCTSLSAAHNQTHHDRESKLAA